MIWLFVMYVLASPRFDVPQEYNDGLIFRHEDVIRLKVPLVAKPAPKVRLWATLFNLLYQENIYRKKKEKES